MGLAFLAAGKYFLINNGPYLPSFDVAGDKDVHWSNPNLFFYPGPARDWVCRTRWPTTRGSPRSFPHALPARRSRREPGMTVGSLILGHERHLGRPALDQPGRRHPDGPPPRAYTGPRRRHVATAIRNGIPGGRWRPTRRSIPNRPRGAGDLRQRVGKPYGADRP